ncbi:MAG: hypothetical protein ACW97Z_00065 [Candidatus Hodarchaeales archaeon]
MKVHCDSNCRPCVFEGGPSRDISDKFNANYCSTCRKAFFCDVGVIQHYSTTNNISYSCVDCSTPLVTKSLDEISMLQARFSLKNRSHTSRLSYKKRFTPKKDLESLKSLSMLYDTKSVSTFHRSLIDEIRHISGLSPQVISNFAREYGISETIISNLSGDREEILLTLASLQPKFIEILYAILVGRDPSIEGGIALRFTVYSENIGDIVFIQPSGALVETGPFDLIAYDHQGMMIWIFCMQGTVDANDIGKIVSPILNQTLDEFKGISSIYIVAQGFSWVSKQIMKKYQGIVIREGEKTRTIPFKLWTEERKSDQRQILFKSEIL